MIPKTSSLTSIVAALALWTAGVDAQQRGIQDVLPPVPVNGFISDGGPILSATDITRLNARIAEVQSTGRGDIGVAILRDLADFPPFEVGTAIFRKWRIGSVDSIGSARRNLGVLLLLVPKELSPNRRGECWFTTGVGAEGIITDAVSGRICRDAVIPLLRRQDYAGAIGAGIDAVAALLAGSVPAGAMTAPQRGAPDGTTGPLGLIGAVSVGLFGAGATAILWKRRRRRRPRQCPRGHGPMRLLDESADDAALSEGQLAEETLDSADYDVWVCDACGEKLVLQYRRWMSSYSKCRSCGFWTVKTQTRTIRTATTISEGLNETTMVCQSCKRTDVQRHSTPRISVSAGSSSGGGSASGGSSFGGSGASSGGGGGSSY
ncbi:MAG: TPM domain-containing protein [Gemmatimonadota bacterium]